jgi:phage host-nuclease inhibitor protein Gam
MARRKKVQVIAPDKSELPAIMKSYKDAESELKKIQAEKELKIAKIREQYTDREMQYDTVLSICTDKLEAYAVANRESEFSKKKSMELSHGSIGFRVGQWKVSQRLGFKVAQSLALLRDKAYRFVRQKEEIDKEAIINEREREEVMAIVRECGLELTQEETFYIKTKEETLATA